MMIIYTISLSVLAAQPVATLRSPEEQTLGVASVSNPSEADAAADNPESSAHNAPASDQSDIVVTATRRLERVQDVPISISVLTDANLRRTGADRFDDYLRTVPGVTFNSNGANSSTFTIRGINTSTLAGNTQSPVAVYYDDLPTLDTFGPLLTPDIRLFDTDRVEVLRGPQGTLFGSGSLGGAIRIISNKPRFDRTETRFEASLATTANGDPSYALNGALNLPLITGKAAIRVVGYIRRDGGFVDNERTGRDDVNRQSSFGGRIAARIAPFEALTVTATAAYQRDRPYDSGITRYNAGDWIADSFVPQPARQSLTTYNLVGELDLGFARLTSSSTYARRTGQIIRDFSPVIFAGLGPLGIVNPTPFSVSDTSKSLAQEIRLASNSAGPLSWLVGGFYLHNRRGLNELAVSEGAGAILAPIGFPSDALYSDDIRFRTIEKALFGEASFRFTPRFTVTAGARLFSDSVRFAIDAEGLLNGGVSSVQRRTKDEALSPKFALRFEPTDRLTFYAQAAKGYRIGQNNLTPITDPVSGLPIPADYGPDSLWNYEVGAKTQLFNRKLRLNLALYHIDWRDIQLQVQSAAGFQFLDNAGRARSRGVEVEAVANLLPGLEFGLSGTLNDAGLRQVSPGSVATPGDRLPGAPKFTSSEYIQYEGRILQLERVYLRLQHSYAGKAFASLNNATSLTFGDYHLFQARAGAYFGRIEIAAFGDNLFNSHARANAFQLPIGPSAIRLRPRTVGLVVRAGF